MATILYTQKNSIYKQLGQDCYDITRDARTYTGTGPIIAHPPCRSWGSLRHLAKPMPGEKQLAIHSIILIRLHGGILEHPAKSQLWKTMNLPKPGSFDQYGGWTLNIDQFWWGHFAKKNTNLYILGCLPNEIPPIPYKLDAIQYNIGGSKPGLKQLGKKENEYTPINFAKWLIHTAEIIQSKNGLPKLLTSISKMEPKYINNSLSQNNI